MTSPHAGTARRGRGAGAVEVAEVTAERGVGDVPEMPLHLAGAPGTVRVQLRTTVRRVVVGAGLARRTELVEAARALPGVRALATSPVGGTFIVGGPAWLGLAAVGVLPRGQAMPLDWMLDSLHAWLDAALAPLGVTVTVGRVDGGWCPGFSDVATGGRKLAGLGFRVTRDVVVMRGVLAVRPMPADDLAVLQACHRLIDVDVRAQACTSLAEATGDAGWTVERAITALREVTTPARA